MNKLNKLKELKDNQNALVAYVAADLIDTGDIKDIISYIKDVLNHGCVSGICNNLIYYKDTCEFYAKFKSEIWELAIKQAEEIQSGNVFQMLAELNGADWLGGVNQVENLLAWYAYEETIRKVADILEIEI